MNEELLDVISLIRFSTPEQVAEGKAGVEGQRRVNRAAAKLHRLHIRKEIVVIDVSGRHVAHDPQFQELFQDLTDPTLAGVLVNEQSRIVRPETFDDYPILSHFQRNKKLIFTPTGRIDPTTKEGRMTLTVTALMDGEELHNLKNRFSKGKFDKRISGRYPGGGLPSGIQFVKHRDPQTDKVVGYHWEQDPVWMERMRQAFELLVANPAMPYDTIASKVGGFIGACKGRSIHRAMRNPIWIGIRRYPWQVADEYMPTKRAKKNLHKPRRRKVLRDVPLDVPTREDLEHGAQPIVTPIISLELWDQAQAIMDRRDGLFSRRGKDRKRKSDRFLGQGITFCACREHNPLPLYVTYGNHGRHHLDAYRCASRHKGGPGCGAPLVHRVDLDATIESLLAEKLLEPEAIDAIWAALPQDETPTAVREKIEEARADLERGRATLLTMVRKGKLTEKLYDQQMAELEKELAANEALAPPPTPTMDPVQLQQRIADTFALFGEKDLLSFAEKVEILKSAVKRIVVESKPGTKSRGISSITLSGGWMGVANSRLHSKQESPICNIPDLTLRLPQPYEIPDTFVNGNLNSGNRSGSFRFTKRRPNDKVRP